jgi:Glycoside hydrolase family 44
VGTQAGTKIGYAEIVQLTRDYGNAAKAVNPAALIFGPVNYGWQGFVRLQDAPDANNRDFLDFYLQQMAQAEISDGHRVLDVLDIHWYPEATGGGVRITDDSSTAAVVSARKQAPRSLWDPTYTEKRWITDCYSGPLRLLPWIKDKIAAHYPNTRLAITEYNYGAGGHISGGLAQSDVLGIFGREALFAATHWRLSNANDFIYGAFDMFRNYDGANGSFGDTSIRATTTDVANTSVYASVDAGNPGRMVVVAINKADTARTAAISVAHPAMFHVARVYTLTAASSQPQRQTDINITLANAFQYTMPANSVTTLVLLP